MFRLVAQRAVSARSGVRAIGASTVSKVFFSSDAAPSIKDLLINLTFVDPSGARRKVKGLVGKYDEQ
jgi:hypothetical protein